MPGAPPKKIALGCSQVVRFLHQGGRAIYLIPGPGAEGVKISEKKHAGHDSATGWL